MKKRVQLSTLIFNKILKEMVFSLNVFHPRVKYHILHEIYGASVVKFYWDRIKIKSVIT